MEIITLRKANDIRSELGTRLNNPVFPTSVSISAFDLAEGQSAGELVLDKVEKARSDVTVSLEQYLRMSDILLSVRQKVGAANSKVMAGQSLNDILAEIASIDVRIRLIRTLAEADVVGAVDSAARRLDLAARKLQSPESTMTSDRPVVLSAITPDVADGLKQQIVALKRDRARLDDMRIAINSQVTIEIADDDYEFLQGLGVV
ncbi:hypothetical protein [Gluconobacter potus]|uniref:hypothetical protein n=1 Tax=Gluconobacter potus TaxID=2724927 RepID=UPI000B01CD29|nr:hypothetical protein [Gluconobacter potus]